MAYKLLEIKARDGVIIPCGIWNGEGDIILYLHGIESHIGWFKDMADRFQKRGFYVSAFDRRGSGLSKEERGHVSSYKILLNDISDVINYIRNEAPRKRLYLMGICGGARFAASFAVHNPDAIDGLILVSPAIKTKITLPLLQRFDIFFSSFLNPKKYIPTPLTADMFTKNERYIDFIKDDKLSLHYLTSRFYRELILMDFVLSRKIFQIDIPILLLLAEEDAIVDNAAMARWHNRLKSHDKTIKVFSGCCHFLPFEKNVDGVVDYIAGWINHRYAK